MSYRSFIALRKSNRRGWREPFLPTPDGRGWRHPGPLQAPEHRQKFIVGNEFQRRRDLVVAHHAFLVDDHESPLVTPVNDRPEALLFKKGRVIEKGAIGLRHAAEHVAQQGIGETELFGPCFVGIVEIDADTQYLGIGGLELGQVKLEGQRFLRSNAGEGAHVEEYDHVLLADKVG